MIDPHSAWRQSASCRSGLMLSVTGAVLALAADCAAPIRPCDLIRLVRAANPDGDAGVNSILTKSVQDQAGEAGLVPIISITFSF